MEASMNLIFSRTDPYAEIPARSVRGSVLGVRSNGNPGSSNSVGGTTLTAIEARDYTTTAGMPESCDARKSRTRNGSKRAEAYLATVMAQWHAFKFWPRREHTCNNMAV